ncbi:unnamed protein product [Parnassius mnemosyne]|uniref:Centrosome-associated zinc finger protein CP190 n=1 Tax=Parnassius mnemosyne TaxID=213953 RepID=A0AAV1KH39_9NEOP
MSDIKQVKVDNWGIYFLQRLKHFFNRTDYCDLTLQFQDNAQLKVHRLVLSACTEYFELLERTCEMYEDCLVMPDDLQADVVVPIVNFMYTGQLEFKPELLEKLHQTSQVMNMPVLTKLLDAHRNQLRRPPITLDYHNIRSYSKTYDSTKHSKPTTATRPSTAVASTSYIPAKRSYSKAFENSGVIQRSKRQSIEKSLNKPEKVSNNGIQQPYLESVDYPVSTNKNQIFKEPRPTRYELPEELDVDNVFEDSFTSISYTSTPLMVHPDTVKRYSSKKSSMFDDTSSRKRFIQGTSIVDIVECKKISMNENIFEDVSENIHDESFSPSLSLNSKDEQKNASQLFDQIVDSDNQKTIGAKEIDRSKPKLDHAKIISEVLKKYPHLVKSNKNIKLKILNQPSKSKKSKTATNMFNEEKDVKTKTEPSDFTYETDVIDSKEAAKLIAMGAENVKGPWICLICGTPGRALHFTSYYKFRRHLVDVHNEKPLPNICEYCGLKSLKRNYILHHLYTKHGVEPPPHYHFPKCNYCNYVALTEAFLVKHKLTHAENRNFGCNVCAASFSSSNQLLEHIQKTGHKYSAERKNSLQCIYCLKTFSRETNLYAHLKINHKQSAQNDGIIDESDEEKLDEKVKEKPDSVKNATVKYELPVTFDSDYENVDVQYQIQQKPDGNIHILPKSPESSVLSAKHKILNPGFNSPTKLMKKSKLATCNTTKQDNIRTVTTPLVNNQNEGIIVIDGSEYIVKDNQLIPNSTNTCNEEYLLANVIAEGDENSIPSTSIEFPNIHHTDSKQSKMTKKTTSLNQPIQIVVSNEEEYKALMSSNHSIIFEEGDANKTLAVLTGPQDTSLEGTTVNLENTQSNEMMIIQEGYPLNVTEAVTADNSNIVVVYSHQMDEANKQYQYITSQNIDAQFIQSSAMITHNYDTITTSTPVMSAHAVDTQVEQSWQNNINESVDKIQIESQQQTQTEQSIQPKTIENNIIELQELSLSKTDMPTITTDVNTVEISATNSTTSIISTNDIIAQSIDQVIVQEVDNNSLVNTNISVSNEQLVHKEIQTENTHENNSKELDVLKCKTDDGHNKQPRIVNEELHNEKIIVIEQTGEESISSKNENSTIGNLKTIVENEQKSTREDNIPPISNIEDPIPNMAKEQIQNLAREWSEEESDKETTNQLNTKTDENSGIPEYTQNIKTLDTVSSVYVEESIENIQQEMAKQMEAIVTKCSTEVQVLEPQTVISALQPTVVTKASEQETEIIQTNIDSAETNSAETNISVSISTTTQTETDLIKNNTQSIKVIPENIESNIQTDPENTIMESNSGPVNTINETVVVHNDIVETEMIDTTTESNSNREVLTPETDVEENLNSPQGDTPKQMQQTVITLNKTAHDKISSLLNDWEDNDSQEDNASKIRNDLGKESKEKDLSDDCNAINTEVVPEKINEPTNNIKNLVSDWDDDDDEIK